MKVFVLKRQRVQKQCVVAVAYPDEDEVHFETMPEPITLQDIAEKLGGSAVDCPVYLPHDSLDQIQLVAYYNYDPHCPKKNVFGTKLASRVGFDVSGQFITGPVIFLAHRSRRSLPDVVGLGLDKYHVSQLVKKER